MKPLKCTDVDAERRQLLGAELAEGSVADEILTREGDREVGHAVDGQDPVTGRIHDLHVVGAELRGGDAKDVEQGIQVDRVIRDNEVGNDVVAVADALVVERVRP